MCFKSQRTPWGTPNKSATLFNFFLTFIFCLFVCLFVYSIFVDLVIVPESFPSGLCVRGLLLQPEWFPTVFLFWQICYQQEPAAFIWESWNFLLLVLKGGEHWDPVDQQLFCFRVFITLPLSSDLWVSSEKMLLIFPRIPSCGILYSLAGLKGICKSIC